MTENLKFHAVLAVSVGVMLFGASSYAQEGGRNSFGLAFGGSDFHLKDEHASPLIFRGLGIAPTVEYLYRGEESRHAAEASYASGQLSTSHENFHTDSWRGRFRYAYLQSVSRFSFLALPWNLFLGGSLGSYFFKADYSFSLAGLYNGRSISSWYWSHSLDCAAELDCAFAPGEALSLAVYMPLLSNVSRPAFSPAGDYNYNENEWKIKVLGETRFFPGNFALNARVTYERPLASGFGMRLSYEFSSSTYDHPAELNMYTNALRAGVSYSF